MNHGKEIMKESTTISEAKQHLTANFEGNIKKNQQKMTGAMNVSYEI